MVTSYYRDLTWGACLEGTRPLPHDFQLSIDIYNEWCKYACDWNSIFELLNSIDAQLVDAIDAQARVHYDDSPTSSIEAAAFEYDQSHQISVRTPTRTLLKRHPLEMI
jgi:hypothetical protein